MEEIKIRELPNKNLVNGSDYIPVEDGDGTKKVPAKYFRSLITSSIFFNSVEELRNSADIGLKEGDICETLGYYTPGDGGASKYIITYNLAGVDDRKLIHNLSYSDTLKAEIILGDTLNVHQFGAKGDGVSDDTEAIQAAIDSSDSRVVKFNNNKKYLIRNTININMSNTIIDGDGGILCPQYVDGIYIGSTEPVSSNFIKNVTVRDLNFDCVNTSAAIIVDNSYKVDIIRATITEITSRAIHIYNSEFINIDKCYFYAKENGSMIVIDEVEIDDLKCVPSRVINITNCNFKDFYRGVYVMSAPAIKKLQPIINVANCHYSTPLSSSNCIDISSDIKTLNIRSNTVQKCNTFLFVGANAEQANVSCKDLYCEDASHTFDIGSTNCILNMSGSLYIPNGLNDNHVLFKQMQGTFLSNVPWISNGVQCTYNQSPTGEIFDSNHPMLYDNNWGYDTNGANTISLHESRNIFVMWPYTTEITTINGGVKGQVIYVDSSQNANIVASENKIELSQSSVQLGMHNGITLKFDGLKWVQIEV